MIALEITRDERRQTHVHDFQIFPMVDCVLFGES